jgi:hypothetical protein
MPNRAVAVPEIVAAHQRASVSVLTRMGLKDDTLAQNAAYSLCKATETTCVIAGIHMVTKQQQKSINLPI